MPAGSKQKQLVAILFTSKLNMNTLPNITLTST